MTALLASPVVSLSIDGSPLHANAASALISVTVRERLRYPSQITVRFAQPGVDPPPVPGLDASIAASVGSGPALFVGRITAVEHTWTETGLPLVEVRGYDALHDLRLVRRMASYRDLSVVDVFGAVAAEHGLTVDNRLTTDQPSQTVLQYGETDFAFLQRLASEAGLRFVHRDGEIVVFETSLGQTPARVEVGVNVLSLAVDERTNADADDSEVFAWHESERDGVTAGTGHPSSGWMLPPARAERLAGALSQRTETARVVAKGRTTGDVTITPGAALELIGIGDAIQDGGELVISTTAHAFTTNDGYTTRFSTEPVDQPLAPGAATFTVGEIVDIDDPALRGRQRVALLAFDSIETDWLAVLGPGVGTDRGVVALGDVGDRVIVLGPRHDVGHGVIIGGIANGDALTGPPVENATSGRIVARLPGGARLVIEDDGIIVENGMDSRLEMRKDRVTLFASADLELAAPGRNLLIRADTIDFEQS